ncbi:MAG: hypothetical protein ACI4PF_03130 [Christensenellales bacterium]
MDDKEIKKIMPQEKLFSHFEKKSNDITSKRSGFFYLSIILLNICFLILSWIIISNKDGVVGFQEIIDIFDWKYLLFIFIIILLIVFLQSFPDFISLYNKTKKRKFGLMLIANCKMNFYNSVTMFSCGGYNVFGTTLYSGGATKQSAVDSICLKKFFNRVSQIIYSFIFLVAGTIFYFSKIDIWLLVLGIGCFLINCIILIFILSFDINTEKSLNFIAKLCKLLYNLRLIKDYEGLYKRISNELFVYSNNLKTVKKISILYIVFYFLIQFLRHFILFIIIQSLNIGSYEILFEIIFKCTILDLIIGIFPLQKGTAIFELLFALLFINVFFSGYLLWGLVLYRFFDYFIYTLIFLIALIFDNSKRQLKKSKSHS